MLKNKLKDLEKKPRLLEAQESSSSIDTKPVHRILNESNSQVKSVLNENSNQMKLWKVHHEHFTSVAQSDGKDGRTRFDPVLMNWAIALLVNTSKSAYNNITKVMQLPSYSWVMRKTKYLVGKQGITGELGINLYTIQTMKEKHISSLSNFILGSLSFDDMHIKQGNIIFYLFIYFFTIL